MKIGHTHLKVRDLDRSVDFYQRILGLRVTERMGDHFVFMTAGDMHHEIALQSVGAGAVSPPPGSTGLFHVAFEVPDRQAFARAYETVRSAGPVAAVDHRISWAMYFSDPDGNGLEIYVDTRDAADGARLWDGWDRPLPEAKIRASAAG